MLTCKDCLCYDACSYHIDEETNFTVNECSTGFKNKNEYVKLPVYIGQQVWVPSAWYSPTKKEIISEIQEGKISMLQQKVDKSWKFRVSTRYVSDYTLEEINDRIFFTKESAEKELNERIKRLEEKYEV